MYIANYKEFCRIAHIDDRFASGEGSSDCGYRMLNYVSLQCYNKHWIYGYSIYYDGRRGRMEFPIIGTCTDKKGAKKAFIMNSPEDVETFGEHCMNEDNSIFTINVEKETIPTLSSDYNKTKSAMDKMVNSDKTIFNASIGMNDDRFTIYRYVA